MNFHKFFCFCRFLDINDPSKEIWYYLEISNKKNVNLKKLKENNEAVYNPYSAKSNVIKKRGKGTLTFQICKLEDKLKKMKKETKIRTNSYDVWGLVIDKIKECPDFYLNQRFFYDYLQNYISKELKYYRKVEKIIKIINNLELERKIIRNPEEMKLIQQETEEFFPKDKKEEIIKLFSEDDTLEALDNQNLIHTYELT